MSNRKKIILAGFLIITAEVLVTFVLLSKACVHAYESFHADGQTVIQQTNSRICKNVLNKSRKIQETTDSLPPVISSVGISPFTVSNIDIPVTLTVTIDAEDNKTPDQRLDYAFVPLDTLPDDIFWIRKNCFDVEIIQNGTYAAYVRDGEGNTAKEEIQVITVDMKPPTVKVSLENPTDWCQSNQIQVDARDASELQYSFCHAEDSIVPEWSDSNTHAIDRNGTYIVKVRDAAGNITETEITVRNIDREAPVIQGIHKK